MHAVEDEREEVLMSLFEEELAALNAQSLKGMTPQQARSYHLSQNAALAAELAANDEIVARMALCNANEEGEGWDFMAAEAGISVREFTQQETLKVMEPLLYKLAMMTDAELEIFVKLVLPGTGVVNKA